MMTETEKNPIEIHIRTYRSLLRATGRVKIAKLIDSHKNLNSILHEKAKSKEIDIAAFIYVLLRLPFCTSNIENVVLGQSYSVFKNAGFGKIATWQEVTAPGRRRKMYYDGKKTLAVYIASVTDVDDIITLLAAFQIEWNKFHLALSKTQGNELSKKARKLVANSDIDRIKKIWGDDYYDFLYAIKKRKVDFTVTLLAGSYVEYAKATQRWWNDISKNVSNIDFSKHPVYFVSSNTHSLTNLISGFSETERNKLASYLDRLNDNKLKRLYRAIDSGDFLASKEHFLYYLSKKLANEDKSFRKKRERIKKKFKIHHIPASIFLDIDVQVVEVKNLPMSKNLALTKKQKEVLKKSKAVIVNIDYPLGWAAYQVLSEIGQNVEKVKGIYIMGKAATLNGNIGDVLVPNTVFDLHAKNTYAFSNVISASSFAKIYKTGQVLDGQKTVSVKGTFLENEKLIRSWFKKGYTIIEMETGPYLNAAYEFFYYERYRENHFANLTNTPYDIGIVHYASDTPYSKAKNLGVRSLGYKGIEATYAITRVILNKIIEREMRIATLHLTPSF